MGSKQGVGMITLLFEGSRGESVVLNSLAPISLFAFNTFPASGSFPMKEAEDERDSITNSVDMNISKLSEIVKDREA